jgi:hypothetical protein
MKYLQTRENGKEIEPKLLEMGVDFMHICTYCLCNITGSPFIEMDRICNLSDCYQSRPLIEINGFCEFDIIFYPDEDGFVYPRPLLVILHKKELKYGSFFEDGFYDYTSFSDFKYKKAGSIFTEENKVNYPELYEEALKIINEVNKL